MRGFVRRFEDTFIEIGRFIKSSGMYDGLEVPREPGDYVITTIPIGKWWLRHEYYSSKGELKGVYYNVNTPPEILANAIRYVDLEVDVVLWPDGKYKIIDLEELESAYDMGIISETLMEKAKKAITEIENDIKNFCQERASNFEEKTNKNPERKNKEDQ